MKRVFVKQKGFTLIEIMVVVFIIALIASLVVVGTDYVRKKSRDAKRIHDLESIAQALELYRADHNGFYPGQNYESGGPDVYYPQSKVRYADMMTVNIATIATVKYLDVCPQDPLYQTDSSNCYLPSDDVVNNTPWGYRFTCWSAGASSCTYASLGTAVELDRSATVLTGTPSGRPEFRILAGKTCRNMEECAPSTAPGTGQ